MSGYKLGTNKSARHYNIHRLVFSVLTEEDILKLSVAKIYKPFAFDKYGLNHPEKGGLYDPALGPLSENSDPCETCGHGLMKCVGHFGHINLPLPVVNPLFHKILATIIKLTCRQCFKLQIPAHVKLILCAKFKLLQGGFFNDIDEFEQEVKAALPKIGEEMIAYVQDIIESYMQNLRNRGRHILNSSRETDGNTRNWNVQFQDQIEQILKNYKCGKTCIYCFEPIPKITSSGNKLMTPRSQNLDDSRGMIHKHNLIPIYPENSRDYMRKLWLNEKEMLKVLVPVFESVDSPNPTDIFFYNIIPVLPTIVRPISKLNDQIVEHPRTLVYKLIIQNCLILRKIIGDIKDSQNETEDLNDDDDDDEDEENEESENPQRNSKNKDKEKNEEVQRVLDQVRGTNLTEKMHNTWQELQINVNHVMNREMDKTSDSQTCLGLKQIIEKKDGLLRMHMMGKRVNYACRTVITPDPNLDIDEIGIPETFALKLTYPVPVTPLNVTELRRMILNGPDVHPGAVMIENEDGFIKRLSANNYAQREGIAKTLLTKTAKSNKFFDGIKRVYRHLQNGDMMLLNRQPTLHKPSVMAHRARILKSEKTLRLHYANCKAYNADFDGDEMNAHFPQSENARTEARLLANASKQYLGPKDGTPLSGLIQDHIISGVRLTIRGKFFEKEEYHRLIYSALWTVTGDLILLPASIIKPKELWSGKQVLSTIIINLIPEGRAKINLTGSAKIGIKEWTVAQPRKPKCGTLLENPKTMSEAEVIIRNGELLCGVLDKAHYGATTFGLIHCVYELYGGNCSTKMLSAFGKLFQTHLLYLGFTLGVEDILVTEKADKKRKELMKECRKIGEGIQKSILELPEETPMNEVTEKMEELYATNPKFRAQVDRKYKTALDDFTNSINKVCLPAGLIQKFPDNNLQLMVQSGAKGSSVNTMQISCLLGQIELEGKRPPLMISGRSLPCFPPFDPTPRAGGFIDGRFMTGIEPPEFFFHCMAGREGLIDTAVKTSRSGYLQRCVIKHLEGVSVEYDSTVRDTDGSLIQFYYGEDGLDVSGSKFLNIDQVRFLVENKDAIIDAELLNHLKRESFDRKISKEQKKIKKWESKNGPSLQKRRMSPFTAFSADNCNPNSSKRFQITQNSGRTKAAISLMKKWIRSDESVIKSYQDKTARCPDPLISKYRQDLEFGVLSENLEKLIADYLERRNDRFAIDKNDLKGLIALKVMKTLVPPGEPVGLLAAQSIGEPSTQLTLNTFHFAGRGEMNVTLGIPRLTEIIMRASKNIQTPSMEIPFRKDIPKFAKKVDEICRKLTKCVLSDVLENIDVTGKIVHSNPRLLVYEIKLNFLPKKYYKSRFNTSPSEIIACTEQSFFKEMFKEIKKAGKTTGGAFINIVESKEKERDENARLDEENEETNQRNPRGDAGENHESSDEEEINEDADASTARSLSRHRENLGYDDPDEEEMEPADEENDENLIETKRNLNLNSNGGEVDGGYYSSPPRDSESSRSQQKKLDVMNAYPPILEYNYDEEKEEWAICSFKLPMTMCELDLQTILKKAANRVVLWETPNIKRAITFENSKGETILKTDGINVVEMFKFRKFLQLNRLYSNDIYGISQTYGIEAANKVIIKEVNDVFKMYGITVDSRHLSLIADYMTFGGNFQPMNRRGMENSASPLQQMSFESSLQVLQNSVLQAKSDDLKSPSSRLMVGQPCRFGTGSIDLLVDIKKIMELQSQKESTVY